MENSLKCSNCNEEIVILENKLFFSEDKKEIDIVCPVCNSKITSLSSDGWFFVQTKDENLKEKQIESYKEKLPLL